MKVVSRDEIRLDAKRVQIIYHLQDEWKRKIIKSVILNRPMKNWNPKAVTA